MVTNVLPRTLYRASQTSWCNTQHADRWATTRTPTLHSGKRWKKNGTLFSAVWRGTMLGDARR